MKKHDFSGDMSDWTFEKSTFLREIHRVNRNRIILALLLLAVIIYFDTFNTAYRTSIYKGGAVEVTGAELAAVTDPLTQLKSFGFSANHESSAEFKDNASLKRLMLEKDGTCYLELNAGEMRSSNIPSYTKDGGTANIDYRLYNLPDGHVLLVKCSDLVRLDIVKGTVGYLPSDLRAVLLASSPDLDPAMIAPIFFDATGDTFSEIASDIAFSSIIIFFWGLWFFFILLRTFRLERDPAYRRLFNCFGTVEDNARSIDEEMLGADCYTAGGVTVTENWRLRRRPFSFTAEPRSSSEQ